jgi:hypothetical protein
MASSFHNGGSRMGIAVPIIRLRGAPIFTEEGGRSVPISLAERVRGPDV